MMLKNQKRKRLRIRRLDLASHLHNSTIRKVIRYGRIVQNSELGSIILRFNVHFGDYPLAYDESQKA